MRRSHSGGVVTQPFLPTPLVLGYRKQITVVTFSCETEYNNCKLLSVIRSMFYTCKVLYELNSESFRQTTQIETPKQILTKGVRQRQLRSVYTTFEYEWLRGWCGKGWDGIG